MKLELVVASYSEQLEWLKDVPKSWKKTIYRATDGIREAKKDKLGKLPITRIPNGGREAGQYLWHIIHNREQLADITLFVQGDFLKHGSISQIQAVSQDDPRPMAYLGVNITNDKPWPFELGDMHEQLHAYPWDGKPPRSGSFMVGAQLWARKSSSSLFLQRFTRSITKSGTRVTSPTCLRGLGTLFSEFIGELCREVFGDKELRLSAFRQPEGCWS